jgi:hypothetical protein
MVERRLHLSCFSLLGNDKKWDNMTYNSSYLKHLTNFYQANESSDWLTDLEIRWKYEDFYHHQHPVWITPVQYPTAFFSKNNFGISFTFYYPFPQEFSNQTWRQASRETKYLIEPTIQTYFVTKKVSLVLLLVSSGLW